MNANIYQAILGFLREHGIERDFVVDHPTDKRTAADYFSNVALVAAAEVGEAPRPFAEQMAVALKDTIPQLEKVEVAGPGFLNFYLRRDFFSEKIAAVCATQDQWGHNTAKQGERILLEKSSPNLYKPFHVGHLLNITIGESISRITRMSGAEVIGVAYPSDISLGVAKAVWSVMKHKRDTSDIKALGAAYVDGTRAYQEDETAKAEIDTINRSLNTEKSGEVWRVYEAGRETSLKYFEHITARLGSSFEGRFFESESGVVGKAVVESKVGTVFSQSEGAIVFLGEEYGLHTRVFVTSQGLPVYEAKDIGLIKLKFEKYHPTLSIVFTDIEQKQYFEVIKKAAELTYGEWGERSLYMQHGRLRFADGKVSSRLGNVPLAEDFVDTVKQAAREKIIEVGKVSDEAGEVDKLAEQVAQAAIKYTFLKVATGQNIIFDAERALSFEGDSGPYLQYTYARIGSVLDRAAMAGVHPDTALPPPTIYAVEQVIYQFPEVVAAAGREHAPHKLVHYLTELAGSFNSFYAEEKIADQSDEYAPYKAAVATAVRVTLKNGLFALGIVAPERM